MKGVRKAKITVFALVLGFAILGLGCSGSEDRKASFFERGKKAFEAGDFNKARLDFKNALRIDQKDAVMWVWLGKSERAAGQISQAFSAFSEALELAPTNIEALKNKAQLLIAAGKIDEAKEIAAMAVKAQPNDAGILVLTGTLKQRDGDLEGAAADARAALAKEPGHIEASALSALVLADSGDVKGAESVLNQAIEKHPDELSVRILLGRLYDKVGDHERAIEVLRGLVEAKPDEKAYRLQLASYLVRFKRVDDAEKVLRDALAAIPNDNALKVEFVNFLAKAKGLPAALAATKELLNADGASTDLRLTQAKLLQQTGDVQEAEKIYRALFAETSDTPIGIHAQIQLAALLARQNRIDEAGTLLDQVLRLSKNEPDALMLRAAMALKADEPDRAIVDLRAVLSEYPKRAEAKELLGDAHRMKGDLALAQDTYEATIRTAPARAEPYLKLAGIRARTGDSQGALIILERLLQRAPENVKAQQAIAEIQLTTQDWDSLSKTAEKIRSEQPDHALGHYLEGLVAQHRDEHEAAVVSLERALTISPQATEPLMALVQSLMKLNRVKEAERRVNNALENDPSDAVALNILGDIKQSVGEWEQAKAIYRKAMVSHPGSPRSYARIAQMLMAENNSAEAVKVLTQGVEQTQRNGDLLFRLAGALEANGQIEAAISVYEEVNSRYPKSLLTVNNLAMLLASHPEPPERLSRALALAEPFRKSSSAALRDTLGWVHFQRGEYQQAIEVLEDAVAINGELLEVQYHLALAYRNAGRVEDARVALERLLAKQNEFPSRESAKQLLAQMGGEAK